MPSSIIDNKSPISIISSLCFNGVLIIFCILGLKTKTYWQDANNYIITNNDRIKSQATTHSEIQTDALDIEIAALKKQIEKRKLEKEFEELNKEKQAEIEKLKKELEDLD